MGTVVVSEPKGGFAGKLRSLRTAAGMTQQALADAAGLNKHAVVKLEAGNREPSWATVRALARALGVEVTAFLADDDTP
jgi:transcriptional regulator with XRE-family HTH domain